MSFLTISHENIFFKTQGTGSGAIVAHKKGLEKALICLKNYSLNVTHISGKESVLKILKLA